MGAEKWAGSVSVDQAALAVRMSWAARRQTTRVEDEAYCLMGLSGVNMPLLYGEGDRAFQRLQEQIMVREAIGDWLLLAWGYGSTDPPASDAGVFARSPRDFVGCFTASRR